MDDGIYLIKRSIGPIGPQKTLLLHAYNDYYANLDGSEFSLLPKASWDALGHFNFVQDTGLYYLTAEETLEDVSFDWPEFYHTEKNLLSPQEDLPMPPWIPGSGPFGRVYCNIVGGGCPHGPENKCYAYCQYLWGQYGRTWCINPSGTWTSPPPLPDVVIEAQQRTFSDGEDLFSFPEPSGVGSISQVSVHAHMQGKGQTVLQIGAGTKVYGEETTGEYTFDWNIKSYLEKPGGGAWAWSDLAAGTLKAGIKLFCDAGKFQSKCRRLKVVIEKTIDGLPVTEELWPSADVSCTLNRIAGSPLSDSSWADAWKSAVDFAYPLLCSETAILGGIVDRYIMSDLSDFPLRFSTVISMETSFVFRATSGYGTSYARAFMEVGGTKYYGTTHYLGSDIDTTQEFSDTWATNPATGLSWTYDQAKGVRFGVHYHAGGSAAVTTMYLYELDIEIIYQEQKEVVRYALLDAEFESYVQHIQNPIEADDFVFTTDSLLAERTEILYVQNGARRFQGTVWTFSESAGMYRYFCKSQQIILDYRHFPAVSYQPKTENFDQAFVINSLFSDDTPTFPYFVHMAVTEDADPYDCKVMQHESDVGLFFVLNSAVPQGNGEVTGRIPGVGQNAIGRSVFALDHLTSITPKNYRNITFESIVDSHGVAWDDITGVSLTACHPAMGDSEVVSGGPPGGLLRLALQASLDCDDFHYAISGADLYVMPWPESKIILLDHAFDTHIRPKTIENGSTHYLNLPYNFFGNAAACFDDLFGKLGYELQFRPDRHGNMGMYAASEISRGSALLPVHKFIEGEGCEIIASLPTKPKPNIVVGVATNPQVSTDWKRARKQHILSVNDGTRDGPDLKEYLDLIRDDDEISYEIKTSETGLLLRVGDWIWADGAPVRCRQISEYPIKTIIKAGKNLFSLKKEWGIWRNAGGALDQTNEISVKAFDFEQSSGSQDFTIRAADYARGDWKCRLWLNWKVNLDTVVFIKDRMGDWNWPEIEVNGTWEGNGIGVWRMGTVYSNGEVMSNLYDINRQFLDGGVNKSLMSHSSAPGLTFRYLNDPSFSGGDWINFGAGGYRNIPGDNDYIYIMNRIDVSGMYPFIIVKLNGKVLPPGRILMDRESCEFDLDISEFCDTSASSDTINTIQISSYGGYVKLVDMNIFHTIEGEIRQQRKIALLENA